MAFSAHTTEEALEELYDSDEVLINKVKQVARLINESQHTCFFTGAGISTDAGINDFRSKNGIWTCAAKGIKPPPSISTLSAIPTKTHMSIVKLLQTNKAQYLISQNCDGLHRRSGIPPHQISELHGNGNIEYCEDCGFEYLRDYQCYRIRRSRDHYTGRHCVNKKENSNERCNGRLLESTVDFGQNLPEIPLEKAYQNSKKADLHIALGSSLTVSPACTMPKTTAKNGHGNLVICNLQRTPLDHLCAVRVHHKCDVFMSMLMQELGLEIPPFTLTRNFKLEAISSGNKVQVSFAGFEYGTKNQIVPASLYKSVKVYDGHTTKQITIQNLDQIAKFTLQAPIENLTFSVTTMQHYAEPTLEFLVNCKSIKESSINIAFCYLPSEYKWTTNNPHVKVINRIDGTSCFDDLKPVTLRIKSNMINTKGNLPSNRMWATLSKIADTNGNGGILLTGGTANDNSEPNINFFKQNEWQPVGIKRLSDEKLPFFDTPRWGHSATTVESCYVFIFGGWDSQYQYNDTWLLNTSKQTFVKLETAGDIPSSRSGHSFTLSYELKSLFLFGGSVCKNGDYHFFNDLYKFNPSSFHYEKIIQSGDIPSPRSQHSTILLDSNHILLIGGYNGTTILNDVYVLNLRNFNWSKIETTGTKPPTKNINIQAYRVYPAYHCIGMMSVADTKQILYYGSEGAYILNISSREWKKHEISIPESKNLLGINISDFSMVCWDGEHSTMNLISIQEC